MSKPLDKASIFLLTLYLYLFSGLAGKRRKRNIGHEITPTCFRRCHAIDKSYLFQRYKDITMYFQFLCLSFNIVI